jgi:hypothetical protein
MSLWIPQRGDRVIIPKGTPVRSMRPGRSKDAGRTYEVTVHHCIGPGAGRGGTPGVIEVRWAGSAGYWTWCDLRHVLPVPGPLEKLAALGAKKFLAPGGRGK